MPEIGQGNDPVSNVADIAINYLLIIILSIVKSTILTLITRFHMITTLLLECDVWRVYCSLYNLLIRSVKYIYIFFKETKESIN